jgi:hypothetical protein
MLFLLSFIALGGCSAQEQINPEAQQSIEKGDFRLYQLPMRGNVLPGIEVAAREKAAALCGVKIIEEGSDMIRNDAEKEKQQQLYDYASEYNKQVYIECLKAAGK